MFGEFVGLIDIPGAVLPPVAEEIPVAFESVFPPCEDWTPIAVADAFTEIVAQATGRLVGGLALSRNKEWLRTSIDFTIDAFMAAQKLKSYPKYLRPIMQYFIPEMKLVHRDIQIARKHIKPLLRGREQRIADMGEKGRPIDLLQMMTDGAKGPDASHDFLSYATLAVSFASIHPIARSPAHLILDLCAYPKYIEPLREEVEMMLKEEGGIFTKAGLARLHKMDSLMKESRRFNPMVFSKLSRLPFSTASYLCLTRMVDHPLDHPVQEEKAPSLIHNVKTSDLRPPYSPSTHTSRRHHYPGKHHNRYPLRCH